MSYERQQQWLRRQRAQLPLNAVRSQWIYYSMCIFRIHSGCHSAQFFFYIPIWRYSRRQSKCEWHFAGTQRQRYPFFDSNYKFCYLFFSTLDYSHTYTYFYVVCIYTQFDMNGISITIKHIGYLPMVPWMVHYSPGDKMSGINEKKK